MTKNACRPVRGGGGLCAALRRQLLHVSTMHRGQEPPEPARRRLRCAIPEACGHSRLGRRALHHDGPSHQRQCGPPLPTLWSQDAWTCRSHHRCGRPGQPCHRPASAIEGLPVGARQRQRGVQAERRVTTRRMEEDGAAGWRARWRIGAYHVVPQRRVQRQGGGPKTERPGVVAVRWRRGTGTSLVRAREGPDPRTADGLAPLPLRHWEGSPSRRAVDGRADDLALSP